MAIIHFPDDWKKTYVDGVGRHRRKIDVCVCKACGKETHLRRSWSGPTPHFGVVCSYCPTIGQKETE